MRTLAILVALIGTAAQAAEIEGVWQAKRDFGPFVEGELTIVQRDNALSARIAGHSADVSVTGATLTCEFAGDNGAFRGHFVSDRDRIEGHWIQPGVAIDPTRFASPVTLIHDGDRWRGRVEPLHMILTMNLFIRRDDSGLHAFIRNPERNVGIFMGDMNVAEEDGVIRLTRSNGGLIAKGSNLDGNLRLDFPGFGISFDFVRVNPERAEGFAPRIEGPARYQYRSPLVLHDGWKIATPESAGLSRQALEALVQSILDSPSDSLVAPYIQALLIARHGELVLDEYFYGFGPRRMHDTRSAGKSFAPTLFGIAARNRPALAPELRVEDIFGDLAPFENDGPRKQAITLGDLLSMNSGLDCDDNDDATPGSEDRLQTQSSEPDWYRYMLDLPMARRPGEKAVYCSGAMNLVGGAIARKTGEWLPNLFRDGFAKPLGVTHYYMNLMPTGEAYLGGGIQVRPRDMLKLGQLYLDGGVWRDRRVLDAGWVREATAAHASINEPDDYGYGWWRKTFQVDGQRYDSFYAAGNGGQFLFVIPRLDMVVLIAAGNYGNFGTWRKFRDELMPERVLTAVEPAQSAGER